MVQDACDRVSNSSHDVLDGTLRLVCIRAIATFLVGGLADASDGRQWSIESADDLPERDVFRRFDQAIAASHAAPTGQQPCPFQRQKNLFEKFDWNMLASGNFMALQRRFAVCECELQQSSQRILTFLGQFHSGRNFRLS